MFRFQSPDQLDQVLNKLSEQRDHYYHRLPQEVKNKYIHEVQEAFVEKALLDTLAEVAPERVQSKAPKRQRSRPQKQAAPLPTGSQIPQAEEHKDQEAA